MDTATNSNPSYSDYLSSGFIPLFCKGYHPEYNVTKGYKAAKEPVFAGWNESGYRAPTLVQIAEWEKAGGWVGWRLPNSVIVPDVEDKEDIGRIRGICRERGIEPGFHITNRGIHPFYRTDRHLSAASTVFTKSGAKVTYRVGGKNYLILAPTNGRTWENWKRPEDLPELPEELLPYDRRSLGDVLNCLSWAVRRAYRERHLSGYEDLDAALMGLLLSYKLEGNQIYGAFQIVFGPEYDERQTERMYERTRARLNGGDPVLGTGTFMQRVKEQGLDEVGRFARELQSATGTSRVTVEEEWADPVPFDQYSALPAFPVEALSGVGREMVEAVAEVNQVDPALPACQYLAVLSTCCAKKAEVDLVSHKEPINAYFLPIYPSGNRKSSTDAAMTNPLYEYQKSRQEEMVDTIRAAYSDFKIKEKRQEAIQKRAAGADDIEQRRKLEIEAREVARDMAENPVPVSPVYLVDDITPEKLGALMADNGDRMAIITPEGGLFEIMAGRYAKDGQGNIDLFLKAHAGDYWGNHRIGRESKTMEAPALTLCLAVQPNVVEKAGENDYFRGRGLLARFLYCLCKSQVGYRQRKTNSIPSALLKRYRDHIFSHMDMPFTKNELRLTEDAQALWDEFYTDIENEMKPEGSLFYMPDWGSKLPGAVARIAGLIHLAENGGKGLSMPISVNIVRASCAIGGYFKEHAITVFGLMHEDPRMKLARQIRDYIGRQRPETFKARDVIRHTAIQLAEDAEKGIGILRERGYVRQEENTSPSGVGRPEAKTYRVNPKFFERNMPENR